MSDDHGDRPRCPVCGSPVFDVYRRCATCDTPHHPECWEYLGGCAIYGCGGGVWRRPPLRRMAPDLADLVDDLRVIMDQEAGALQRLARVVLIGALGAAPALVAVVVWIFVVTSSPDDRVLRLMMGVLPYTLTLSLLAAFLLASRVSRVANRAADERQELIDRIRAILGADVSRPYPFGALLGLARRARPGGTPEAGGAILAAALVPLGPYWLIATDLAPWGALSLVLAGGLGVMAAVLAEEAALLRRAPDVFEDIVLESLRRAEDWEDDLP